MNNIEGQQDLEAENQKAVENHQNYNVLDDEEDQMSEQAEEEENEDEIEMTIETEEEREQRTFCDESMDRLVGVLKRHLKSILKSDLKQCF